jgi:hypothetical protein
MSWFSKKSDNELGEYLPDSEAQLLTGHDTVRGKSRDEAEEECADVASEYNAVSSEVEPTESEDTWNCKFRFWG